MKRRDRTAQKALALLLGLACAWWNPSARAGEPGRKKFVELGWDIPDTAFLRAHGAEMERTTPFDGLMFQVSAKDDQGQALSTEAIWDAKPWRRAWLEPALADLRACRFTNFTDNFVRFNATPGNLDWRDDTAWQALADKAGLCAWLMRETSNKGLAIDFESYGAQQFRYDAARGLSFASAAALARRRGALFTQAIAREFPDAVLLALWLNSVNIQAGNLSSPEAALTAAHYGLLPAFIDGMLDALPPRMILVDGCENGYYMDSAEAYLLAASQMRSWNGPAIRLVSPENRAKYRGQVQAGFGFYLDMFLNRATNHYYFPPLDGSRLARLERNLGFARDAADQYVWVYGEQCRWWGPPLQLPQSVGQGRLWEEAMPGIAQAIAFVRDPIAAARQEVAKLRAAGALTNLVANGDFARPAGPETNPLPARFTAWQDPRNPAGQFAWDASVGGGSARARKVGRGDFSQAVPVRAGDTFAVLADCLSLGNSRQTLTVRWQKENGAATQRQQDKTFAFQPTSGEWQQAFGVVTVPPDAARLVVQLNVGGQVTDEDVCWFDNVALYRLRAKP
jgi:hypothetical protein